MFLLSAFNYFHQFLISFSSLYIYISDSISHNRLPPTHSTSIFTEELPFLISLAIIPSRAYLYIHILPFTCHSPTHSYISYKFWFVFTTKEISTAVPCASFFLFLHDHLSQVCWLLYSCYCCLFALLLTFITILV